MQPGNYELSVRRCRCRRECRPSPIRDYGPIRDTAVADGPTKPHDCLAVFIGNGELRFTTMSGRETNWRVCSIKTGCRFELQRTGQISHPNKWNLDERRFPFLDVFSYVFSCFGGFCFIGRVLCKQFSQQKCRHAHTNKLFIYKAWSFTFGNFSASL